VFSERGVAGISSDLKIPKPREGSVGNEGSQSHNETGSGDIGTFAEGSFTAVGEGDVLGVEVVSADPSVAADAVEGVWVGRGAGKRLATDRRADVFSFRAIHF